MTFGQKTLHFYTSLAFSSRLPKGIEVMNPFENPETLNYTKMFLDKYYSDTNKRVLVLGINPGRFGGGVTGVNFTDPWALENYCEIPNNLSKKRELSSIFVYKFINYWGGADKFYKQFFLSALSPLGFTKFGKNYNYYDDPILLKRTSSFIVDSIKKQVKLGVSRSSVIIFGSGKNLKEFSNLNNQHKFFRNVYSLEHPRYIMQYKRSKVPEYLEKYKKVFDETLV